MTLSLSRRQALALGAGTLAAAALGATPALAQAPTLRFSSFEPPTAWITSRVLMPWAEEVTKAAAGALNINVFPGGALGKNPGQQLKLMLDGVADLAWIVLGLTPGRFDDTDVVTLPFLIDNGTEASLAVWRMYERGEFGGFDDLKVLGLVCTPPAKIHGTVAIKGLEDMRGKRMRANGDHLVRVAENLGAVPVTMSGGQVAESLSRGLLDLALANWGFVGDFKVSEVAHQHLVLPMGATAVMVAMRKDKFQALPEAARTAIDSLSGEKLSLRLGQQWDLQEAEVADKVAKSGKNSIRVPDAAETAKWRDAVEKVNLGWRRASDKNEKLYQSITAELARIRAGNTKSN